MKILLLTPSSPFDQTFGGGQRSAHLYAALLKHGDVDVLVLTEGPSFAALPGGAEGEIAKITFTDTWHRKYRANKDISEWIADNIDVDSYDLIVGRYLTTLCMAGIKSAAPQLVDVDDAYYRYVPPNRTLSGRITSVAKTFVRRHLTKRAMQRFDYVWVASTIDLTAFPVRSAGLLPNIPSQSSAILPPPESGNCILFVGAMWYGPNRDAVDWFIANCWRTILAEVPSATFTIVGGCPIEEIERWNKVPGVRATGFVDDLVACYQGARFTVSPIRFGGGTQIKVLESLGFGRTAVVSRFIHQRYADIFVAGQSLLVAESAKEFIEQCVELLDHSDVASKLAAAGHQIVNQAFTRDVFDDAVNEAIILTGSGTKIKRKQKII